MTFPGFEMHWSLEYVFHCSRVFKKFISDFDYFGVQNGDECYCGDDSSDFIPAPFYQCNQPCSGDPSQFCGSTWRLNVFRTNREQTEPLTIETTTPGTTSDMTNTAGDKATTSTTTTTISTTTSTATRTTTTTSVAQPNAVLVLNTRFTSTKPMVVSFDGKEPFFVYVDSTQ